MTCIVGIEHAGKVWIGGDSAGTAGWSQTIRSDEKVFTNGPFVMGFTTSYRMGQLLRYKLSVGEQTSTQDDFAFMVTTFIDAVRQCLKDGGYAEVNSNVDTGGTFLVGYKGTLYKVESDFQVGRSVEGFATCGCGEDLALGALAALDKGDPRKRIEAALAIATKFNAGVGGPITVVSQ